MKQVILATTNKGKLKEFNEMGKEIGVEFITIDMPEIIENGKTFTENSYIKAKAIFDIKKMPVLADDSGLEVEILDMEPGVHTARYRSDLISYSDRCKALVEEVNSKKSNNRKARFVCVLTLICQNGEVKSFEGITKGEITKELKGNNGHGYDPIFYSYDLGKTFGESSIDEKDKVSHRGRAFSKLKEFLLSNDTI